MEQGKKATEVWKVFKNVKDAVERPPISDLSQINRRRLSTKNAGKKREINEPVHNISSDEGDKSDDVIIQKTVAVPTSQLAVRKRKRSIEDASKDADDVQIVSVKQDVWDVCPLPPCPEYQTVIGKTRDMSDYHKNEDLPTQYEKSNKKTSPCMLFIDGVRMPDLEPLKHNTKLSSVRKAVVSELAKYRREKSKTHMLTHAMEKGDDLTMFLNDCTRKQSDTVTSALRGTQLNQLVIHMRTILCNIRFYVVSKANKGKPVQMFETTAQVGERFSQVCSRIIRELNKELKETGLVDAQFYEVINNCCIYYKNQYIHSTTEDKKCASKFDFELTVHERDMRVHMYPKDDHLCMNVVHKKKTNASDTKPCDMFPVWTNEVLLVALRDKYMAPRNAWITNQKNVRGEDTDMPLKVNGLIMKAHTTVGDIVKEISAKYFTVPKRKKIDGQDKQNAFNTKFSLLDHFGNICVKHTHKISFDQQEYPLSLFDHGFGLEPFVSPKMSYKHPISASFNTQFGKDLHPADFTVKSVDGNEYAMSLSAANNGVRAELLDKSKQMHLLIYLQTLSSDVVFNPYYEPRALNSPPDMSCGDDCEDGEDCKQVMNADLPAKPVVYTDVPQVMNGVQWANEAMSRKLETDAAVLSIMPTKATSPLNSELGVTATVLTKDTIVQRVKVDVHPEQPGTKRKLSESTSARKRVKTTVEAAVEADLAMRNGGLVAQVISTESMELPPAITKSKQSASGSSGLKVTASSSSLYESLYKIQKQKEEARMKHQSLIKETVGQVRSAAVKDMFNEGMGTAGIVPQALPASKTEVFSKVVKEETKQGSPDRYVEEDRYSSPVRSQKQILSDALERDSNQQKSEPQVYAIIQKEEEQEEEDDDDDDDQGDFYRQYYGSGGGEESQWDDYR